MKRCWQGWESVCGLLAAPWPGEGQGMSGRRTCFRGGAAARDHGDRLQVVGKERLDLLGVLTRSGQDPVGVRILWEFPGKVRLEKRLDRAGPEQGRAAGLRRGREPAQAWRDGGPGR